jgi:hypothetical protein
MSKKFLCLSIIALFLLTFTGTTCYHYFNKSTNLGHLYLTVSGGTATILLDQQTIGPAPIKDFTANGGWYTLDIVTDNYTYSTPIRLHPQTATIVDWRLSDTLENSSGIIYELISLNSTTAPAQLEVTTIPSQTLFTINQDPTSHFAPTKITDLPAGNHQLTANLPGHNTFTAPFVLTDGYLLKITINLATDH